MSIDTHCHLDFPEFDADRAAVLERARQAGVTQLINPGADISSSRRAVRLAAAEPMVRAGVGIHPHQALAVTAADIAACRQLSRTSGVVAIGEIGLDFYDRRQPRAEPPPAVRAAQEQLFTAFLDMALSVDLPVIVHCRQAAAALTAIIRQPCYRQVRGVMHCFSQDQHTLEQCLSAGWYISFAANVMYPAAAELRRLICLVPASRLLLETDAPFLSPQQYRGRRNEPAWLTLLIAAAAHLRGTPSDELAAQIHANAGALFGESTVETAYG